MKIIAIFALILMTSAVVTYEVKRNTAEVEQIQGLYIFYKSKPVSEYDYLGTLKSPAVIKSKPTKVMLGAVKRAKRDYPTADGLIFHDNMYSPDAIKFKE